MCWFLQLGANERGVNSCGCWLTERVFCGPSQHQTTPDIIRYWYKCVLIMWYFIDPPSGSSTARSEVNAAPEQLLGIQPLPQGLICCWLRCCNAHIFCPARYINYSFLSHMTRCTRTRIYLEGGIKFEPNAPWVITHSIPVNLLDERWLITHSTATNLSHELLVPPG